MADMAEDSGSAGPSSVKIRIFLKPDKQRLTIFLMFTLMYSLLFVFVPLIMLGEFIRYLPFFILSVLLAYPVACIFTLEKNTDNLVFLLLLVLLPALLYYVAAPTAELCKEYLRNKSLGNTPSGFYFIPKFTDIFYHLIAISILSFYLTPWLMKKLKSKNKIINILQASVLGFSLTIVLFSLWSMVLSFISSFM